MSIIKHLVITSVLLITYVAGFSRTETVADTTRTRNTIHLDGASLFYIGMYSLNYERTIFRTDHYNLSINAGFGGWYFIPISQSYYGYSIPLSFNNLIGSGNNYFETDIGLRYIFFNDKSSNDRSPYFPVFNLGYRYQRPDGKGLIFRTFIGLSGIGIGVGKAF